MLRFTPKTFTCLPIGHFYPAIRKNDETTRLKVEKDTIQGKECSSIWQLVCFNEGVEISYLFTLLKNLLRMKENV